jgi:V/A-type H+-transporting ATPase subunit I
VAIVKMNKISIIGLNKEKSLLIKDLMDLGVVEISSQDAKLTDPEWISYIRKDGNETEVLNYDAKISKISEVLESLDKYDKSKRPLFSTRKPITSDEFSNKLLNNVKIEENVSKVLDLIKSLNELSTEENKIEAAILSLRPWAGYDVPLEMGETKYTSILMGVVPSVVEIEKLNSDLEQKTDSCYYKTVGSDKDQHYIAIICLRKEKEDVYEVLKQYGFNTVVFKELVGTAAENIAKYEQKLQEINAKKEIIEKEITEAIPYKEEIELLYDHLVIERDKNKILSNMLKTDTTFYIEGWIPEESKEKVEQTLNKYESWHEIKEPEEGEQCPILLKNSSFVQPFESVTELYSLPSSSNIDPTAVMSPFYILFFGMMLGDVGYGALMSILCFVVLKRYDIEGNFKKMLKMFFYCGLSTMFWGAMFGSWFGDGITAGAKVLFNVDFPLKPIWLNPIEEPITVLIVSFVFGLIHLFAGMGMKAYILIRDGHPWEAFFDVGLWYLFIIGPILWLAGGMILPGAVVIGKWMTIISAIGLVLTQGRSKSGIISKFISGVLSLYGITGYLSDVLSYSRLLALGLATGVISSVLSIIGSMGGSAFLGKILFLAVFLFGHVFNFAINGLGSFVHSARLQYVEFFGKFYEGGGDAFNPLMKKTKYIKIIND